MALALLVSCFIVLQENLTKEVILQNIQSALFHIFHKLIWQPYLISVKVGRYYMTFAQIYMFEESTDSFYLFIYSDYDSILSEVIKLLHVSYKWGACFCKS